MWVQCGMYGFVRIFPAANIHSVFDDIQIPVMPLSSIKSLSIHGWCMIISVAPYSVL